MGAASGSQQGSTWISVDSAWQLAKGNVTLNSNPNVSLRLRSGTDGSGPVEPKPALSGDLSALSGDGARLVELRSTASKFEGQRLEGGSEPRTARG